MLLETRADVPLAPRCTMKVGGAARFLIEASDESQITEALIWAKQQQLRVRVLGGGSNVVVSDAGVSGLVLSVQNRGVELEELAGDEVRVMASAGEPWDDLVRFAIERNLQGLECLSGIPGLVGATPIQNVGAYGQDVSETIERVRVLDRESLEVRDLTSADCRFSYRDSRFKSVEPERFVVLAVSYRLRRGAPPSVRYQELERHLRARGFERPSLREVRESVLELRRSKSMLLDPSDPNGRSCGSFFVNPIVSAEDALLVAARASGLELPQWPQPDGRVKLAAAWLIEKSGFAKGTRRGAVGLSSRHALSIVCHDGARADDVLSFAREVVAGVRGRFGVELTPEPVIWA